MKSYFQNQIHVRFVSGVCEDIKTGVTSLGHITMKLYRFEILNNSLKIDFSKIQVIC